MGLGINVYKEEFSLIATCEGKDGNRYQQWGKARIKLCQRKHTPNEWILLRNIYFQK